jgi:hypothetical protein
MNHVGVIVDLSKEQRGYTFGVQGPPIEGAIKFMGRVIARDMKRAEAAGERLRAAGYETHICWDVIDVYSGVVFMEIFKDFTFAGDLSEDHMLPILDEINEIVRPYCADCIEASTVPHDYVPHSDEELLRVIYPRLVEQASS